MTNAIVDTNALVVTAQNQMLEKLQHSEVSIYILLCIELKKKCYILFTSKSSNLLSLSTLFRACWTIFRKV